MLHGCCRSIEGGPALEALPPSEQIYEHRDMDLSFKHRENGISELAPLSPLLRLHVNGEGSQAANSGVNLVTVVVLETSCGPPQRPVLPSLRQTTPHKGRISCKLPFLSAI